MLEDFSQIAQKLGNKLLKNGLYLATAESCTGGLVAAKLTDIAGSSKWFERGFVTYSNLAKHELLNVPLEMLKKFGAVSQPTAQAMAEGALANSAADIALSITGIAGPGGGSDDKPVGMVYFGFACNWQQTDVQHMIFSGNRDIVRMKCVLHSMKHIIDIL